jgi:hypothetical protein
VLSALAPPLQQQLGVDPADGIDQTDVAAAIDAFADITSVSDKEQLRVEELDQAAAELATLRAARDQLIAEGAPAARLAPIVRRIEGAESAERELRALAASDPRIALYLEVATLRGELEELDATVSLRALLNAAPTPPSADAKAPDPKPTCHDAITRARSVLGEKKVNRDSLRSAGDALDACKSGLLGISDRLSGEMRVKTGVAALVEVVERLRNVLPAVAAAELGLGELCKVKDAGTYACSYRLAVSPGASAKLDPDVLVLVSNGDQEFKVAFRGEDGAPASGTGYLAVKPAERQGQLTWNLSGTVGYLYDPDPDAVSRVPANRANQPYSLLSPYEGQRRSRFTGTGALDLEGRLGSRARGQLTLQFKSGDLGGEDSTGQVRAGKYTFELFSRGGISLRLGKYLMASPGSGLAVNENGEGFELAWRWFSLGHLVRRESNNCIVPNPLPRDPDDQPLVNTCSAVGIPNDADQDSDVTILQVRNLSLGRTNFWRGFNLLALHGEDESSTNPHEYETVGAETYFAVPKLSLSGSLSLFRSQREPLNAAASARNPEAHGSVGLLVVGRSWLADGKLQRSLQLRYGRGSGDDPNTAERNEGYLGETSAFTGGTFFLGNVSGLIGLGDDPADLKPFPGSLTNKEVASIVYLDKRFSLLEAIADLLQLEEAVIDRATTVELHQFRLDEALAGERGLGTEVDIRFEVQVPAGVVTKLEYSRFLAGDALQGILREDPWRLSATVSVKL